LGSNITSTEEEAKLAIENGDVREDGVPMITVIADIAWSKRSYKSNYNNLYRVVSNNDKSSQYIYSKIFCR